MSIYMQIGGVTGSVTDQNHSGWIELDAVELDAHRAVRNVVGSQTSRDVALPSLGCIWLTKSFDNSSVDIFQQFLKGKAFDKVVIHFCSTNNNGAQVYKSYTLQNVLVAGYHDLNHSSDAQQSGVIGKELIRLSYSEIQQSFTPRDSQNVAQSPKRVSYNLSTASVS